MIAQHTNTISTLGRRLRAGVVIAIVWLACLALAQGVSAQNPPPQETPAQIDGLQKTEAIYPLRYAATQRGNIIVVGNTSQTCNGNSTNGENCAAAQNGTGAGINDRFNMVYVDVDGDAGTFNSSRATLNLPANAQVTRAFLYWGGNAVAGVNGAPPPNIGISNTVWLAGPNGVYSTVVGQLVGVETTTGQSNVFAALADVTSLVNAGSGQYTLANIQTGTGIRDDAGQSGGLFAGWSLFVVYQLPSEALRNITIFDGLIRVSQNSTGVIDVNNFLTPLSGPFSAQASVMAFEGDLGLPGDQLLVNGVALGNALNPVSNVFNGSVSSMAAQAPRSPAYANALGVDVDTFDATGIVPNGSSSASIRLPTTQDNYFPVAVAFSTQVFEPDMQIQKQVTDLNGGVVNRGDVLRYTISLTSTGVDTATHVHIFDAIPPDTEYVPGTLMALQNPGGNTGAKTDAANDDIGEFNAGANQVRFWLGAGAVANAGGHMGMGERAQVSFDVRVTNVAADGQIITNTAHSTFEGTIITATFNLSASASVTAQVVAPDLSIIKTDGDARATPDSVIVYTLTARNKAAFTTATGVVVTETLPDYTTFVGPAIWQQVGSTRAYTTGLGVMTPGESRVLQFVVRPVAPWPLTITQILNTAIIWDDYTKGPDIAPTDNVTTDTTPIDFADLAILKTDGVVTIGQGGYVTYSVVAINNGVIDVNGATVIDEVPPELLNPRWTCVAGAGAACLTTSGTGSINANVNLGAGSRVTFTLSGQVFACGGFIQNSARIVAPEGVVDPLPGNNGATDVDLAGAGPHVMMDKAVSSARAFDGDVITFTLTVKNYGVENASAITVTDNLPGVFPYLRSTASQGSYQPASGRWMLGELAAGQTATLQLAGFTTGAPSSAVEVENIAKLVSAPAGNTPQYASAVVLVGGLPTRTTHYLPAIMK